MQRFDQEEFIRFSKENRQWLRKCRIQHAEYRLIKSETEEERNFWQRVIDMNEDEHVKRDT